MAYFNFTINGNSYTNDPTSALPYGYKFTGYEYIPALGNLFTDLAATVAVVLGYKEAANSSKVAAGISETNAGNSASAALASAVAAASAAAGLQGTSTSAVTIGTGTKTFTTQAGKQFNNTWVQATDSGDASRWVFGYCTYSGTTLSMTVANANDAGGSGSCSSWVLSVNGPRGVTGATGATGTVGTLQSATDFAYDPATSSGLNIGIKAGDIRSDNATTHHNATTTALTNNATNYVEVNASGVSANTTGFSAGSFPICTAVTLSGAITTVTDKRGFAVLSSGTGAVVPIGGVIPMSQTANLVTIDGIDYLKTGVLAPAGSYTSAPLQNVFSDTTRSITSSNFSGVASGNGITVAVVSGSATGQISYDNGNTWSPVTLPSTSGYLAITFGASLFVAVGNGVCATSADGINWFARTIAAQNWTAVLYDGVNFVAVSSSSSVGTYSANGITWFGSSMPSSQAWGALSCGNGVILATLNAGSSNVAASSADHGQTWSARTLPKSFTLEPQNSAFGAGVFVVLAIDPAFLDTNCVFTTADCVTWNVRNYGVIANQTKTMTSAGGMFIGTRGGSTTCYTSTDAGVTWVPKTMNVAHAPKTTCVANGGRVIGLSNGSTTVDIFTMAYGRGYHIALFADQQNQAIPLYMRMS